MRLPVDVIDATALVAVMLCWIGFALPFVFRKRPPKVNAERARDRRSVIGIVIQAAAYSIVWGLRRPLGHAFVPSAPAWLSVGFDVLAVLGGAWAVWLVVSAVIVLGKQWSLTARVLEGHELATEGPYAVVRHPIYTAMLVMLVATGIVVSRWPAVLAALAVFAVGTALRVRSEERLLRETFGPAYDAYAARVRAVVPWRRS